MENLIYWLTGAVGVPLIEWLKGKWGISGQRAMWLTAGVAAVLALAALFMNRELALADFTLANLSAVFGQVLASATLAYKLLLGENVK